MTSRKKGSVPNVKRAMREGQAGRAERKANLNKAHQGTQSQRLGNQVGSAFRQKPRKNS